MFAEGACRRAGERLGGRLCLREKNVYGLAGPYLAAFPVVGLCP